MYFSPMRTKLLLILCCLLVYIAAPAQEVPARAYRLYMKAMAYKAKKETDKACKEMQKAIDAYGAYTDAYSALGEWYFDMHLFTLSAGVFDRASKSCPGGKSAFAKPLARSLIFGGNPTEGMKALSMQSNSGNDRESKNLLDQAYFIEKTIGAAWKDTAFNMGPRVNTKNAEVFPFISADTQTFYFTRRMNNIDLDFYYAAPDSCGGWFTARNMGNPPNTPDQELGQTISADNHYLFFTRCENRSEDGWTQGGCDLYMAYRSDSIWSVPQSFGATINTPAYEGMACLSADNRELYFVSDRVGGYGGMDIWVSSFENGLWQEPRNLGPGINTAGNETAPFLHIDNKTLYFASDGRTGMGGSDLYMARRTGDTTWSAPVNMGYPINTPYDEMSVSVTIDGQKLYFASDRDSLAGNYDMYEMHLPDELQPKPVGYVKGYVYDSLTKERLTSSSIYVSDAIKGDTLYHFMSNRGDGSFMITLPVDGKYIFGADHISYMDKEDTISFSKEFLQKSYQQTIALLPNDYQKPVSDSLIFTVHFPKNSYKLSDSDIINIKQAMAPWMPQISGLTIFVNGYTDNSGTPMINESLSFQRAGLVKEDIMMLGIEEGQIYSQGWGEANPIAPNDIEDNMSKNRRVEIIVRY